MRASSVIARSDSDVAILLRRVVKKIASCLAYDGMKRVDPKQVPLLFDRQYSVSSVSVPAKKLGW
jgi:hypothetical protein